LRLERRAFNPNRFATRFVVVAWFQAQNRLPLLRKML